MSDFPRGWTLNAIQDNSGVPASITVAAESGVVHVLDSLFAKLTDYLGAAGAGASQVRISTAAGVVLTTLLSVPATTIASDTVTFSDLNIASSPGGTIVVAFLNGFAGLWEEITIQGHDI